MLGGRYDELRDFYNNYASIIDNLDSSTISEWCSKKTVTKAVLYPGRTNEARVKKAIESAEKVVQEGDKIHVYFKTPTELALPETFDGQYCRKTLYRKLYKTVEIFKPVADISLFPNYALKRNQPELQQVLAMRDNPGFSYARLSNTTPGLPKTAGEAR